MVERQIIRLSNEVGEGHRKLNPGKPEFKKNRFFGRELRGRERSYTLQQVSAQKRKQDGPSLISPVRVSVVSEELPPSLAARG
jgi:hypothetical protein